jgi:ABC-2 type transport system permease protein
VVIAFQMLIYISAFYTMSAGGLRLISAVLTDFMAGSTIPLPFFPEGFRRIAEILPFAAMQNMPLRIYSGDIAGVLALRGLIFQLFWLCVLVAAGRLWTGKALRKVVTQGG